MQASPSSSRPLKSLLVTGGAGFIGSAFIRWLFKNPEFRGKIVNYDALTYAGNLDNVAGAVDAERYQFVRGDICDEATNERLFAEHRFRAVVNLAAESHVDR